MPAGPLWPQSCAAPEPTCAYFARERLSPGPCPAEVRGRKTAALDGPAKVAASPFLRRAKCESRGTDDGRSAEAPLPTRTLAERRVCAAAADRAAAGRGPEAASPRAPPDAGPIRGAMVPGRVTRRVLGPLSAAGPAVTGSGRPDAAQCELTIIARVLLDSNFSKIRAACPDLPRLRTTIQ